MKIAHFCRFGPHQCGQYSTVRDLILAERAIGIDAQFIDCGTDDKGTIREGLVDGPICTQPLAWALNKADIAIRHTSVPSKVYETIPVLLALHGRPENSFLLESYDKSPVISTVMGTVKKGMYKAVFSFWPEHVYYWMSILGGTKVHCIPAPVDFDTYTIEGEKHDFGRWKAGINLVVADMWREDHTPFNLVFAAQYFKENYYAGTKLHMYGVPTKKSCFKFLAPLQKNGVVGEVSGVVGFLPKIYRAADIILTPNIIATRIIRESLASGLPVVAPHGCTHTQYRGEPRDYKAFATAIKNCYEAITPNTRLALREYAHQEFGQMATANAMKALCEEVLANKKPAWNAMSILEDDWDAIKNFVETNNVKRVVEFGSGISTQLLDKLGITVHSFETNPEQVKQLEKKLANTTFELWDAKTVPHIEGDMAFIDGPHGGKNREPSYRAVAESGIPFVACHDIHRAEDKQWVDKYFSEWEGVSGTNHLLILRRV